MSRLSAVQRRQLHEALVQAFVSYDELDEVTQLYLNERLIGIAAPARMSSVILELITWSEARGVLGRVIDAAIQARPHTASLVAAAQSISAKSEYSVDGGGSTHSSGVVEKCHDEVWVEEIRDIKQSRSIVEAALELYEERIPRNDRFEREQMIDLVRRHLSDEFGPNWTLHFLAATCKHRCVGMLVAYEDLSANLCFVAYLAAKNARSSGKSYVNVTAQLAERLIELRKRRGLPAPRFLFEIDDPRLTEEPREKRRRVSRFRLFQDLAPFDGLRVRALEIPYLQPRLEGPAVGHERRLLLCYAAQGLHTFLPKSEVDHLLTWTYTQLYGDDIFDDPPTRDAYARHTRSLLRTLVVALPDRVRLLQYRDLVSD